MRANYLWGTEGVITTSDFGKPYKQLTVLDGIDLNVQNGTLSFRQAFYKNC